MTQTPPDHYCPTPEFESSASEDSQSADSMTRRKDEREPYQTYSLIPRCPWCGTDLDLRDRVSWIRECPQCPYLWVAEA